MSARKSNSVDIAVGRNIRFYRLAAKMSQEALGDKIGVSFQQVQKYEKGTNRVGAGRLNHIATVLGVAVTSMFDGVSGRPAGQSTKPSPIDLIAEPHAFRLANAFAEISDDGMRRSIVHLVEQLVSGKDK